MARTKLEINKEEFQDIVANLESESTFENPSALWKAVSETDWAQNLKPRPLTAAVAYQRAKEMEIKYETKPGKRGRQKGEGFPSSGPRKPRAKKMEDFALTFEGLRKKTPKRWQKTVDRAEKGSLRAALTLFCLECVGYEVVEIKKCSCIDCPIFPHRPYKAKLGEPVIDDETEIIDDGGDVEEAA